MLMRTPMEMRGFTLIELMITLVVASILLAWAVPSFTRFLDRTALTSETNNWVGVINFARNEAITRGERVSICRTVTPEACDGASNCSCGVTQSGGTSPPNYHTGYMIFTSTGNGTPINFAAANNELIRTGRASSDKVTIQGNGQANNAFSFMPDGALHPDDIDDSAPFVTARHILCVTSDASDDSTAASTNATPGRVVIVSEIGRPRVREFDAGRNCFDPNSSNTAANDYGN